MESLSARDRTQHNTFVRWMNIHLAKARGGRTSVKDLSKDLETGVILAQFAEVMIPAKLAYTAHPKSEIQYLNNVGLALTELQNDGVVLHNIHSDSIVKGDMKIILGLMWQLMLFYQVMSVHARGENPNEEDDIILESAPHAVNDEDFKTKQARLRSRRIATVKSISVADMKRDLIAFCNSKLQTLQSEDKATITEATGTKLDNIECTNLDTCWSSGDIFCGLVASLCPNPAVSTRAIIDGAKELETNTEIVTPAVLSAGKVREVTLLGSAIKHSEQVLGIPHLMEAEDIAMNPDSQSLMAYVSFFKHVQNQQVRSARNTPQSTPTNRESGEFHSQLTNSLPKIREGKEEDEPNPDDCVTCDIDFDEIAFLDRECVARAESLGNGESLPALQVELDGLTHVLSTIDHSKDLPELVAEKAKRLQEHHRRLAVSVESIQSRMEEEDEDYENDDVRLAKEARHVASTSNEAAVQASRIAFEAIESAEVANKERDDAKQQLSEAEKIIEDLRRQIEELKRKHTTASAEAKKAEDDKQRAVNEVAEKDAALAEAVNTVAANKLQNMKEAGDQRKRIEELEEEVEALKKDIIVKDHENDDLQRKLTDVQEDNSCLQESLDAKNVVVARLEEEMNEKQVEIDRLNALLKDLESLAETLEAARKETEDAREEVKAATERAEVAEARVEELEKLISELESKCMDLLANTKELEEQREVNKNQGDQITSLEKDKAVLEEQVAAQLEAASGDNKRLIEELEDLKAKLAESDTREVETQEKLATSKASEEDLKQQVADKNKEIAKEQTEKEQAMETFKDEKKALKEEAQQEEQKANEALRVSKEETAKAEDNSRALDARVAELLDQIIAITAKHREAESELEKQLDDEKAKNSNLHQQFVQAQEVHKDCGHKLNCSESDLKQAKVDLEAQEAQTQSAQARLEAAHVTAEHEQEKLQQRITELEAANKKLLSKLDDTEGETKTALESFNKEAMDKILLNDKLELLQNALNEANENAEHITTDKVEAVSKADTLEAQNQDLSSQISDLKARLCDLEDAVQDAQEREVEQTKVLDATKGSLASMSVSYEESSSRAQDLDQECQKLTKELEEAQSDLDEVRKRLEHVLNTPPPKPDSDNRGTQTDFSAPPVPKKDAAKRVENPDSDLAMEQSRVASLKKEFATYRATKERELAEITELASLAQNEVEALQDRVEVLEDLLLNAGIIQEGEDYMSKYRRKPINNRSRSSVMDRALRLLEMLTPQVGITIAKPNQETSEFGVRVLKVLIGKAAYNAGLQPGEVIEQVNGFDTPNNPAFASQFARVAQAGSVVSLQVVGFRGGNNDGEMYVRNVQVEIGSKLVSCQYIKELRRMAGGVLKVDDADLLEHIEDMEKGHQHPALVQEDMGYIDEDDIAQLNQSNTSNPVRNDRLPSSSRVSMSPQKLPYSPRRTPSYSTPRGVPKQHIPPNSLTMEQRRLEMGVAADGMSTPRVRRSIGLTPDANNNGGKWK